MNDAEFDGLLRAAYAEGQRGAYDAGITAARGARERARAVGSVGLELRAARLEASSLSLSGHGKESIAVLLWAFEQEQTAALDLRDEHVAHALVSMHLAWVETTGFLGLSTITERLEALDRLDRLVEKLKRPGWRSGSLSERASIMRAQSRWEEAIALGADAIRHYEPGSPGSTLASYRQQHADILLDHGRLESAEIQYLAILMDGTRSRRDEKNACVGVARCALQRDDLPEARQRALDALRVATPLGDSAMCGPLEILTRILLRGGELELAATRVEEWVERARRSGAEQRVFHALARRVDLQIERRDRERARACLDEVMALATRLDGSVGSGQYARQLAGRQSRVGAL